MGASVNLAARLQAVAHEGDVLIDGVLAHQLQGKIHVVSEGKVPLKNIGVPDVFKVLRA
ncbi:hypothetical protein EXS73_00900 [Candidatus Pacearchaeota archaeon]|nr:hypothetical protein [Candidatus Pacearchaeota archaeon]